MQSHTLTTRSLPFTRCLAALSVAALSVAALCLTTLFAGPALADGDPTTDTVPRLLPYQGILEVDGEPLDASGADALHITFALYAGADAEQPAYRQDVRVEVYTGRFTATIGPTGLDPDDAEITIDRVISAADDLYLGMTLLGDPEDPTDDMPLANRQRIHASPYAMWTTSATDLSVARDLVIGRNVIVGGDLSVEGDVALPPGSIDTAEVVDGTLRLEDIDPAVIGEGLAGAGDALGVDSAWLQGEIRSWVRDHCRVQLGWRDACTNCGSGPAKNVTVQANGQCIGAAGADTRCRANNTWGGVNTDGTVDGNDVFYIRMICD